MADENLEELRLALVMNGGVSLAVWMGGVTNEIFRLVTQCHPVYADLLKLTRSTARVDVISGTSAGGINGAALALALIYGSDFSSLREVWMNMGAFDELLRPPVGDNPASLLRGDDYFLPQIEEAFSKLAKLDDPALANAPPPTTVQKTPIDLRMTTTLLKGRLACTVDDLGTPVGDMDHRARFRFQHTEETNHFKNREELVKSLSRAARSTASFPFAFEPSKVAEFRYPRDLGKVFDVSDEALPSPQYVIDGGILDNKPFRGALQSIFQMKTQRSVRRVLAYINPDPGKSAQLDSLVSKNAAHAARNSRDTATGASTHTDRNPDQASKAGLDPTSGLDPDLASVLVSSLFAIPQAQTIVDQLNDIQSHNNNVRMRRNRVLELVRQFSPSSPGGPCALASPEEPLDAERMAKDLFNLYRIRRFERVFDLFVYRTLPSAVARYPDLREVSGIMGKHGSEAIRLRFERIACNTWYPQTWPKPDDEQYSRTDKWKWGSSPTDFAAKILLNFLRLTQWLLDYRALSDEDPTIRGTPDETPDDKPKCGKAHFSWADPNVPPETHAHERSNASARRARGEGEMDHWWKEAYSIVDEINKVHREEQNLWLTRIGAMLEEMKKASDNSITSGEHEAAPWLFRGRNANGFDKLFQPIDITNGPFRCADIMYRIAEAFLHICPITQTILQKFIIEDMNDADQAQALKAKDLLEFFLPPSPAAPATSPGTIADSSASRTIVRRLLQLEVIEFALNDRAELDHDALIELVQISGNSQSPIGGKTLARDKLLGLQLAHFAAFYKYSWRANDWMFGRLDGAERLVRILLNPDRLMRIYQNKKDDALSAIHRIAVETVPSEMLKRILANKWRDTYEQSVKDELHFLTLADNALPDTLPHCAAAITLRLHYGILEEEIRNLYNAILDDQTRGADAAGAGEACVKKLAAGAKCKGKLAPCGNCTCNYDPRSSFSPEQAVAVLNGGLLGAERLGDEAGSDLFTRTFAHALAALQNTLANKGAKLGPVSALFASLRLPILGFYFVAQGLTRQSRTSAALNGGILATGTLIVALHILLSLSAFPNGHGSSIPGLVVTIGWTLLAYGVLMSTLRAPRVMCFEASLALLAIAVIAWVYDYSAILIAVVALMAIVISVRVNWLQWVLGFVAIVGAGLWGTGDSVWITTWMACQKAKQTPTRCLYDHHPSDPILLFTGIIVVVLLIALWQATALRKRLEGALIDRSRRKRS